MFSRAAGNPRPVLNGTVVPLLGWYPSAVIKKNAKKQSCQEVLASVRAEMAKPRIAESARIKIKRQDAAIKRAAKA